MGDVGTSSPTATWRRRALRALLGSAFFVAAGLLGRWTIIDGESLSLIWPAAGFAALWIGTSTRATRWSDLGALGLAALVVNYSTGASAELAAVVAVTNVAQVVLFVAAVRHAAGSLWGFGGAEPLHRIADLGRLTVASLLSSGVGAALGMLSLQALAGGAELSSFLVWWGRNAVALVVVVVLGILLGAPLATHGASGVAGVSRRRMVLEALRPPSPLRLVEASTLAVGSVGLAVLIFRDHALEPLSFLLLVMAVWAGIRFTPLAVVLNGVAMGTTGVAFTLAGQGPFATIESLHYRALVAQVFVMMTVLTGLALAFSRSERDAANAELAAARRAADERSQLLDAVLESLKEGIVVVEGDGRVLVHNAASRELAGLVGEASARVRPASAYGLFHANGLPLQEEEMAHSRALAGESVAPFDLHVRTPTVPEGRILEVSGHPLRSEDPTAPRRAMVNLRDVTLDRQHRDTLASFAGVVAHDLFSPLSIVDGWTEALTEEFAQGAVSPAVGGLMVARIKGAAAHMREFIADLMSYTIARDQSLRTGPVDLTAMVRSLAALRTAGPGAPVIAVGEGLGVWADSGLTRQLLDNLIGNAVKYVHPGTRPVIEVSGEAVGEWLEVRVSDNGIGIPEQQREAVFETFHQAHSAEYGGTGLGLAICRRIVDRHGGTIHIAPGRRGTGCTVVFRLPLAAPAPGTVAVPAQQSATR